ncbi:MAG: (2Fe-2S)-binding protein [Acetobacteraceae bacterium]
MYVCLCNALTDRHVRDAAHAGASRPSEVYAACGCAAQCGSCSRTMRRLLDDAVMNATSPDMLAAD